LKEIIYKSVDQVFNKSKPVLGLVDTLFLHHFSHLKRAFHHFSHLKNCGCFAIDHNILWSISSDYRPLRFRYLNIEQRKTPENRSFPGKNELF